MRKNSKSLDILEILGGDEYSSLMREFNERSYSPGALIYTPYHEEDLVFIVKQGKVRVYLSYEDKEFSLGMLTRGDIYSTHTRAYVSSIDNVKLLVIPTAKFYSFAADSPFFNKIIIGALGDLLKQSFSIINDLMFKDVQQRIVEFFLFEAQQGGDQNGVGVKVCIDLTMEQLAMIVGATRQTVSTIINDMNKAGVLLKESRSTYCIPDINKLRSHFNE